jgi:mercuric ion transport protein
MEDTSARPLDASRKWTNASAAGAVLAALGASLCCIGPLAFAILGIGGAGLLVKFEAYRPYFTLASVGLLGLGFYFGYRPRRIARDARGGAECGCEHPRSNRLGKMMLWVATALVIGIWSFPFLAALLFG